MRLINPFPVFVLIAICASSFAIETEKDVLSFGNVKEGEKAALFFNIGNGSLKQIEVAIRPSCDCITAEPQRLSIAPKSKKAVKITVDTSGYSGKFEKEIYVQSNDADKPYFSVTIAGNIAGKTGKSAALSDIPDTAGAAATGGEAVGIIIFASPGCRECNKLRYETIPAYEKKLGVNARIEVLSLDNPGNYEKLLEIENKLGKPMNKIPVLYAAGNIYGGEAEILRNIDNILRPRINTAAAVTDNAVESGHSAASIAAGKLKFMPIVFAGLVDSINPCAFATVVFFLSYMSLVLKKSRYEVFLAGIVFIVGVFITYFMIGIGIFKAVLGLTGILKYSKILYITIGIFVFALSLRHFYEAAVLRKTGKMDDDEVKLKLPDWVRGGIEKLITKFTGLRFVLPFIFALAVVVTLLELVCTGQVYLPTIIYLTSVPAYRLSAYSYLAFYCFLFVAPLILIFGMYYFGLTTLTLKRFFKDNIVAMKVTMAVFFLTMAVFMVMEGVK